MHFYDFNIGEYAKKTQHLTNEEDLAYRRALDMYYDTEKPLLTDGLATLSRRLRVDQQALKNVLDEFFPNGINKHAEEKIAEYYAYISKQQANGKLGGRPKRTQAKPTANPKEPSAKPTLTTNHLPLPTNNESLTTNKEDSKTKNKVKNKNTALIAPDDIFPEIENRQIITDWLVIRKEKNAPVTQIALEGIKREALKAKMNMADTLRMCCENNWSGFKSSWLEASGSKGGRNMVSSQTENDQIREAARKRIFGEEKTIETI